MAASTPDWTELPDDDAPIKCYDFDEGTLKVNPPELENLRKQTFEEMELSEELEKAISFIDFQSPSVIQQYAIPILIKRKENIVAQARSGTGKTAAFGLGVLSLIDPAKPQVQAICICPTRELAIQNYQNIAALAQFSQIKVAIALPDAPPQLPVYTKDQGIHFIVGTPGKLVGLFTQRHIKQKLVNYLIFDEAEELLAQKDLAQQAKKVKDFCGETRVICFSATFEDEVENYVHKVAPAPRAELRLDLSQVARKNIRQICVNCTNDKEKLTSLVTLFEQLPPTYCSITFCNTRSEADRVIKELNLGPAAAVLHGHLEKKDRDKLIADFRMGTIRHLISTNVLSRGLDIPTVGLVINYGPPGGAEGKSKNQKYSAFYHRIGRCARWAKGGLAVTLVESSEKQELEAIKNHFNYSLDEVEASNLLDFIQPLVQEWDANVLSSRFED